MGSGHTCARTTDGETYCWGFNRWGQLGNGALDPSRAEVPLFGAAAYDTVGSLRDSVPQRVQGEFQFRLIVAGNRHTCGLTREGQAYCWGFGRFGELGTGERASYATPQRVATDLRFRTLSAGGTHTCGVTKTGAGYCWGGNWHGQLGIGRREPVVTRPMAVTGDRGWVSLHAGGIHTCGLTKSQRAYCWGDRRNGRLGTGRMESQDVFEPAPVAGGHRFLALSASAARTCGVALSGTLRCWGRGVSQPVPEKVALGGALQDSVRAFSVSDIHVCAVTAAGQLSCVETGGDEFNAEPPEWTDPLDSRLAIDVSVGSSLVGNHGCALYENGLLECWGDNTYEQLGSYAVGDRSGTR